MADKCTHALVRFRQGDKDEFDTFKLPTPTTQQPEAVLQWENSVADFNRDNPGNEKVIMDLDLLAPGQEKVKGTNRSLPSAPITEKRKLAEDGARPKPTAPAPAKLPEA